MKIDLYQSQIDRSRFLSVKAGTNVQGLHIDGPNASLYARVNFKRSLSIDAGDKRIAINADDVIAQINSKGYALHGATVTFTETTGS